MKYKEMELKPIDKVQAFDHAKKLLTWDKNDKKPAIRLITALVNIYDDETEEKELMAMDIESNLYDYACEIPKPKTRKMNSLEMMEYLHLFQLWLNGIKTSNEITSECNWFVFPVLEGDLVNYALGLIVYDPDIKSDNTKYSNYSEFNEYDKLKDCKFAILKNGKTTEFELPEVNDEN